MAGFHLAIVDVRVLAEMVAAEHPINNILINENKVTT